MGWMGQNIVELQSCELQPLLSLILSSTMAATFVEQELMCMLLFYFYSDKLSH